MEDPTSPARAIRTLLTIEQCCFTTGIEPSHMYLTYLCTLTLPYGHFKIAPSCLPYLFSSLQACYRHKIHD